MQRDEGLIALGAEVLAAKLTDAFAQINDLNARIESLSNRLNGSMSHVNELNETIETLTMAIRTINALTLERARA